MLIPKLTMKGTIKNHGIITASVIRQKTLTGYIKTGTSSFKPYTGEYIVIPMANDIILETKDKRMDDDLTIKQIPYAETSNDFGTTVTIGG